VELGKTGQGGTQDVLCSLCEGWWVRQVLRYRAGVGVCEWNGNKNRK
jgi:hypothetical protein